MSNKTIGNALERKICNFLFCQGFWAHNFASTVAGQPADIIACRNGKPYLIDAKVCSRGKFPLTRVEANQITAMDLWDRCGNGGGWFACELPSGEVYFISAPHVHNEMVHGKKELTSGDIRNGVPMREWSTICGL